MRKYILTLAAFFVPFLVYAGSITYVPSTGQYLANGKILVGNSSNIATAVTPIGLPSQGVAVNCSPSISGTTLTIKGAGTTNNGTGTTLSTTNPCYVGLEGNTAGITNLAKFTSNVTLSFSSTSDTDNNSFGITATSAWASELPFILGVVADPTAGGSNNLFIISRKILRVTGATVATLCQKGDVDCDAETDGMLLSSGQNLNVWLNQPITPVGFFSATYSNTGGFQAWTFTLNNGAGFNNNYKKVSWAYPVFQNGGAEGTHILANGGIPAIFTTNTYNYTFTDYGVCVDIGLNGDGGTDANGGGNIEVSLPLVAATAGMAGTAYLALPASDYGASVFVMGNNYFKLSTVNLTVTFLNTAAFTNGVRTLQTFFCYRY